MIKYKICQDFDFTNNEKMVNFVYLHLIGSKAVSLYNYLIQVNDYHHQLGLNINLNLEELYNSQSLNQDEFDLVIKKLEAINLVETYRDINKEDLIVFKINEPLKWSSFIKNKKYMNLLKTRISDLDFEKIKFIFQGNNKLSGLVNTSTTFEEVFGSIDTSYNIDFDLIYNHIFNKTGTIISLEDNTKTILNNAYEKYHISYDDLLDLIDSSLVKTDKGVVVDNNLIAINLKNKIDLKYIKNFNLKMKINRNNHIFLKDTNMDNFKYVIDDYKSLNSEQYLACIQKCNISDFDVMLINNLRKNYNLPDFIINILIDYSICVNSGRVEPEYINKIAITINRLNLKSINDVINHLRNAAKKKNYQTNSNECFEVKW